MSAWSIPMNQFAPTTTHVGSHSADFSGEHHEADKDHGWPRLSSSDQFARDSRLSHFIDSLFIRAQLLKSLVEQNTADERLLSHIRRDIANFNAGSNRQSLFWKNSAWTEAYRIELLLMLVEPVECLTAEIEYRLGVAESIGVKDIKSLRAEQTRLSGRTGSGTI
jgi:hypothetical protein